MWQSNRVKYTLKELLYYTALIIFIFRYVVLFYSQYGANVPNIVHNMCYMMVISLMLIKGVLNIGTTVIDKKVLLYLLVCFIGFFVGMQLFELNFVGAVLLMIFAYDIDYGRIVKVACAELSLLLIFIICSCRLNVIEDIIRYKNGHPRHGLGFIYIGAAGAFYLQIVLMIMFIKRKNMNWLTCALLYLIELVIYHFDKFVGNFLLSSILFFSFIIFIKLDWDLLEGIKKGFWKYVSVLAYPVTFACSILLSVLHYQKRYDWLVDLDKILNGRVSIPGKVMEKYGVYFWGNNFETIGLIAMDNGADIIDYNYIDNAFLNLMIRYGIVLAVIVCGMYTLFFIYSVNIKDKMNVIWIMLILAQSIVYSYLVNIPNNIFVILVVSSLMRTTRGYKLENYRKRRKINRCRKWKIRNII